MLLIRGLHNVPDTFVGCVATIGSYDGVHTGHQKVIQKVRDLARARRVPGVAISFEPTPGEFFDPNSAPARLTRFREKYRVLAACGLDGFLCLRFDQHMAELEPRDFIDEILVRGVAVSELVIGDDFRFGRRRAGEFATLKSAGDEHGFLVHRTETVESTGTRISSSEIRAQLAKGDLDLARSLLGRPYSMSGRVVLGEQLGRTLGFPTANLRLHRCRSPLMGIFAVRVYGANDGGLHGVASLGSRPTVGGKCVLLEVHIFDFDEDLYGKYIDVEFVSKIRDELHFESVEKLTEQMRKDSEKARRVLLSLN